MEMMNHTTMTPVNQIIYFITAVTGLTLCLAYYIYRHSHHVNASISSLVNIVLQSALAVTGIALVLSTFFDDWKKNLADTNLYILISGIVVFVVAFDSLRREFNVDK